MGMNMAAIRERIESDQRDTGPQSVVPEWHLPRFQAPDNRHFDYRDAMTYLAQGGGNQALRQAAHTYQLPDSNLPRGVSPEERSDYAASARFNMGYQQPFNQGPGGQVMQSPSLMPQPPMQPSPDRMWGGINGGLLGGTMTGQPVPSGRQNGLLGF